MDNTTTTTIDNNSQIPLENDVVSDPDHGWQKVVYPKRNKKAQPKQNQRSDRIAVNGSSSDAVFGALEKKAEERRRLIEAQRAAAVYDVAPPVRKGKKAVDEEDDEDSEDEGERGVTEKSGEEGEKKPKVKKVKKPKVTVAEAAAKIDAADLAAFLADVTVSYETQQDIQLMRFADYFGRAFASVTASQFPWAKLLKESPIAKVADNPVLHLPEAVYKTSVDWINQRSYEALGSFVIWSLDSILADLANQQPVAKGSKKVVQKTSSKSQVAMFVVLAMVLRRKPDVLINIFPTLREHSKYQGQDKLPLIVWMVAQATQGDLAVGLYSWAHQILPVVGGKGGSNPQTRDLVLQSVERILSGPKARTVLVNNAVRKGERLIPPSAFDLLLSVTFPSSAARVKATERFEAVYPTLKEVALAGSPGSKAMKQVAQQIMSISVRLAGESIPELANEATSIFIWCLTQNPDCIKQWENLYLDNLEASVAVLRKLCVEWNVLSAQVTSLEVLGEALQSFRHKNEKALTEGEKSARQALLRDADKYCKVILGRLSRGHGCLKSVAVLMIALGVGTIIMSSNVESWDWNKLSILFGTQPSI